MARIIDKSSATKIARKLDAQMRKGRNAHMHADIYIEGKFVLSFGIRHGSNKEQGHDHIMRDLHVGPRDARLLAQCPLSKEAWIEILREKNIIAS